MSPDRPQSHHLTAVTRNTNTTRATRDTRTKTNHRDHSSAATTGGPFRRTAKTDDQGVGGTPPPPDPHAWASGRAIGRANGSNICGRNDRRWVECLER